MRAKQVFVKHSGLLQEWQLKANAPALDKPLKPLTEIKAQLHSALEGKPVSSSAKSVLIEEEVNDYSDLTLRETLVFPPVVQVRWKTNEVHESPKITKNKANPNKGRSFQVEPRLRYSLTYAEIFRQKYKPKLA